ncbi:MAG: hypothetical protein ACM3ML_07950 [Micromonosporaceae bacterium]
MLPGIMIGVLALIAIASAVLFCRLAARSTRTLGGPEVPPTMAFLGGMLSRTVDTSWGLARLQFFAWGLRLRGSMRMLRLFLPTWEVRYEELTKAQLVSAPVARRGVRFRADGAARPMVFWTYHGSKILDHLEQQGVAVDRSVTRLRRPGDLERRP